MTLFDPLWLLFVGFIGGALGSMIGLGGGIVFTYVLLHTSSSPASIVGTSLFAVMSNAMASTIWYAKHKMINYPLGLKLGLASVPGPVIGAILSSDLASDLFKILFGIMLVTSALYILLRKKMGTKNKILSWKLALIAVSTSFFAGIISSLFGIGGGIIFVPLLVVGMGMTMKQAAPTSNMILLFTAASGAITHTLLGHPYFIEGALLAVGAFVGAMIGARMSIHIKERYLQIMIVVAIMVAATKLFIDTAVSDINIFGT